MRDERTPLLSSGGGGVGGIDRLSPAANPSQETQLSSSPRPSSSTSSTRQVAPDLLRGILMILMALDHTSVSLGAYDHGTGHHSEDASTVVTQWSDTIPFVLRTMTHLVAPGFSLLMGMGVAYFIESRSRQGWSVGRQLRHILVRSVAILVVNYLSVGFMMATWTGKLPIVPNIVLVALAVDYLVVGSLYVLHVAYLEPWLQRTFARGEQGCSAGEGEGEEQTSAAAPRDDSASFFVSRAVDVILVVFSAVILFANIWTSPNNGACPSTKATNEIATSTATSSSALSPEAWLLGGVSGLNAEGNFSIAAAQRAPSPSEICESPRRLLWYFLFQQVNCPSQGILSGFPPVGWLSFVLFGVAYGRWLLATSRPPRSSSHSSSSSRRTISAQTINATLSLVFALLFVSTRTMQWGNTSTGCLATADQQQHQQQQHHAKAAAWNPYLASWKSFLYIVKYPPDVAFASFTLSANFALLALLDFLLTTSHRARAYLTSSSGYNVLLAYGVQPLFFYGVHFWVLMAVQAVLLVSGWAQRDPESGKPAVGLGGTFVGGYLVVLGVMWPLCVRFGRFKRSRGGDSVWKFL